LEGLRGSNSAKISSASVVCGKLLEQEIREKLVIPEADSKIPKCKMVSHTSDYSAQYWKRRQVWMANQASPLRKGMNSKSSSAQKHLDGNNKGKSRFLNEMGPPGCSRYQPIDETWQKLVHYEPSLLMRRPSRRSYGFRLV